MPPPLPGNGMWARLQGPGGCHLLAHCAWLRVPWSVKFWAGAVGGRLLLRLGSLSCVSPCLFHICVCVCAHRTLVGFGNVGRVWLPALPMSPSGGGGGRTQARGARPHCGGAWARCPDGLSTPAGCCLVSLSGFSSLGLLAQLPCLLFCPKHLPCAPGASRAGSRLALASLGHGCGAASSDRWLCPGLEPSSFILRPASPHKYLQGLVGLAPLGKGEN